jgi:putative aminopeptidase FrvX
VFPTWTDASGVQRTGGGVATGGVYMPRRNSHSPRETIDLRDVVATEALLRAFIESHAAASLTELAVRPRKQWV